MAAKSTEEKTIRSFAAAAFLNDLGSDIIFSVWPIFLTQVLGANMAVVGMIDGIGNFVVSASQAITGYLSDRLGKRKMFIWLGYLFAGISRIGYALVTSWPMVIPFRILDRGGKIRTAPRDAIIADISTLQNRGTRFGILRASDNLGAVFGILIAIFFLEKLGIRTLFLLAAIPSFLAVLLLYFNVPEQQGLRNHLFKGISFRNFDKNLKWFIVVNTVFTLGTFSYSFLLMVGKTNGWTTSIIPVFYLIFTVAGSIFSIPAGKLCDRLGRKPVLMGSFLLWGIVALIFSSFTNKTAIGFAFILYGMHLATLTVSQTTFASELIGKDQRASVLGGFQMILGLCAFPASFIAGVLWEKFDPTTPFYLAFMISLVSSVLLLFVKETKRSLS